MLHAWQPAKCSVCLVSTPDDCFPTLVFVSLFCTTIFCSPPTDQMVQSQPRSLPSLNPRPIALAALLEELSTQQSKMCAMFTVAPSKTVKANEEGAPPPPPPFISPLEECNNATVNEWGVWPADYVAEFVHDSPITTSASAAEIESRVRCGDAPVNRRSVALVPDRKCVFKWAYATTAAATVCQCSCCLLGAEQCEMCSSSSVPAGMSISIGSSLRIGSGQPRLLPPCSILSRSPPPSSNEDQSLYNYHHHQYQQLSQPVYDPSTPSLLTSEHSAYSPAGIYSPSSASSSSQPSHSPFPVEEYPFLDSLIAEVRQEMSLDAVSSPSPSTSSDFSSVSRKSSASSSFSSVRDVFVTPGQTLVIRGDDGQEYKLIVERIEGNEAHAKPLKRKMSDDSLLAPKRQRAPPVSLVNLSDEEIADRKKQQNRAAALRYRQKLRENRVLSVSAKQTLTQRNAYLRDEADRLSSECDTLRKLIFNKLGKNAPVF
ncbi:unnamed protein product [Caenorhabditis sp. 36 PRJEB53466]|nr:unnamed protein product [Caenorhabditis sp. 36 PRJEB53466]